MRTYEEISALTTRLKATGDVEHDHAYADEILVECIRSLAQALDSTEPISSLAHDATELLIAKYEAMEKWYA